MLGWLSRKPADPKKELQRILGDAKLPTFPAVVLRALSELRSAKSTPETVARVLGVDPGVSARLLRLTNCAANGLRREVRSVEHAVALLGRGEVESLLLAVASRSVLPEKKSATFAPATFWRLAARRAAVARGIAARVQPATRSECFTAGLLQDMAIPLLVDARGPSYEALLADCSMGGPDLLAAERSTLGWDHSVAAGWLSAHWGFPTSLVDSIGAHHDEPTAAVPVGVLVTARLDEEGPDALIAHARELCGLAEDDVLAVLREAEEQAADVAAQLAA